MQRTLKIDRRRRAAVTGALGAVLALTLSLVVSCKGAGEKKSADSAGLNVGNKAVVLAMSSTWDTMQPYFTTSNYGDIIFTQVYDKLVYQHGDYSISPRLVKSWESSPDKATVTLHINPKAKWHDGLPVTSADIVWTARFAANPDIKSKRRNNLIAGTDAAGIIDPKVEFGVVAVDDLTVDYHFKSPLDPDIFLYNYCRSFYVLPAHIGEGHTADELNNGDFWTQHTVGSGPFKYVSQISGERVTLTRNDDYHLGVPKFETLIIRVVPTTSMLAGLKTGEIDIISGGGTGNIPLEDWAAAKADPNLVTLSHPTLGYQALNISGAKSYMPKEVRQAISLAVNRQAIVDGLLDGEGEALAAFSFPSSHPYYQTAYVQEYNSDKAKQLLQAAGWDANRSLQLLVPAGNTVRERSALLVQQDLAKVGVKAEITTADFSTVMAQAQKADGPDGNFIGSAGSLDPDEAGGWFNYQGATNFSALSPAQSLIWDLFTEARQETSFATRKPLYDNIQRVAIEEAYRLFLYVNNALVAWNPRISNADIKSFANVNWDTWNWDVK